MAFVDIKCLESLLIEGEDLIATEGLGSSIKGFIIRIFQNIGKILKMIGNLFKSIAMKFRNKKPVKTEESENTKNVDKNVETVGNQFRASIVEDFNTSINNTLEFIVQTYQKYIINYYNYSPSVMYEYYENQINKIEARIEHGEDLLYSCKEKAENILALLKECNNKIYYSVSKKCSEYCMNTSKRIDEITEMYNYAINKITNLYNSKSIIEDKNDVKYKTMYNDIQSSCVELQEAVINAQKYVTNIANALNSATIIYD